MATIIVSTDIAGNVKPSFATSPTTGLTVRANGEEVVQVLDANGNAYPILFEQNNTDPAAPVFTDNGVWIDEQGVITRPVEQASPHPPSDARPFQPMEGLPDHMNEVIGPLSNPAS